MDEDDCGFDFIVDERYQLRRGLVIGYRRQRQNAIALRDEGTLTMGRAITEVDMVRHQGDMRFAQIQRNADALLRVVEQASTRSLAVSRSPKPQAQSP